MQRPDLTGVDPTIVAYIEYLEKKATPTRPIRPSGASIEESVELSPERASEALPAERETTVNIITFSETGLAKRTQRHLYTRQHRGGMGVFGIDMDAHDSAGFLQSAEENQQLLLFTDRARVFRMALSAIPSEPVFGRGATATERLALENGERVVGILPDQAKGYVALAAESGRVRWLRHHLFGEHLRPGTALYNFNEFGPLASVCWAPGDAELFMVTQQGIGIRFAEKSLTVQGDQGIRLTGDDKVVAITSVYPDSSVFIAGADGRGTQRLMSGFAANKTPGGTGKIAFKNYRVIGAVTAEINDDIFIISKLGKVIRFPSSEVPSTEGVVQGVNCMSLRGDEAVAVLRTGPIY